MGGTIPTRYAHLGAKDFSNSDYKYLSNVFENRINPIDVLVDVGCGKGRVINFWLRHAPNNQIIGIELDDEIAAKTRKRLQKHKNVTIISGDAVSNIPADGTLFYLFNPFDANVLEVFKNRLISIFGEHSSITVLYSRGEHAGVFSKDLAWTVKVEQVAGPTKFRSHTLAIIKMAAGDQTSKRQPALLSPSPGS